MALGIGCDIPAEQPGFTRVFQDGFDTPTAQFPGPAYSAKWFAYPGWPDTSKHGKYDCTKVCSVDTEGNLNLKIHTENGIHYVAAPVPRIPGSTGGTGSTTPSGQRYGTYSVKFRAVANPSLHGYKTAWLLWPDSGNWPHDGEIDFPEGNLDSVIQGFVHHQGATANNDQDAFKTTQTYTPWHIATTEWTAGKVRFILDGVVIGETTTRVPNTPMHWVLQTETALDGTVPADSAAGVVQIDWVSIGKVSQ